MRSMISSCSGKTRPDGWPWIGRADVLEAGDAAFVAARSRKRRRLTIRRRRPIGISGMQYTKYIHMLSRICREESGNMHNESEVNRVQRETQKRLDRLLN